MNRKRKILGIAFIVLISTSIFLLSNVPAVSKTPIAEQTRVLPSAQVEANNWQKTVVYGDSSQSLRLTELNRVLGIPMEDLKKLSAAQVEQLYIDNANQLGVMIYHVETDVWGNEVIRQVAGSRVFKPDDFSKPTSTPAPYPKP